MFRSGELAGNYSEKDREYRELLRRIWEANHQSYILILSREEPSELAVMLGNNSYIHSLPLGGIGAGGREIFRANGLSDEERWDDAFAPAYLQVIEYLGGNPAYLESVSIAVKKLFGSKVGEFCKYEELFLTEEIESLLTHQFSRLSIAEQEVIKLLAGEAAPIGISRSILILRGYANESLNMSPADVGKAIISLGRRGLIVGGVSPMGNRSQTDDGAVFSLRSIVKKFILQL